MKRMLINATQQEELRMAMVDGQRLYDLNIEAPASDRRKANIYLGKITRIEPSLEAAFVDYGADRHGFLPLKEISSEYFSSNAGNGKPNIKDVLREGQNIVVQVEKEERGNKGAALTTFVSLAGRFIVLKPNKARSGGVSRRITGQDRDAARKTLNAIEVPDGMSVIVRTAGIDRSAEELAWDLENLLTVWTAILNVVLERPAPFLIYRESDSVVRALRDYLTNEVGEILIDDEQTYKDAYEHVETTMPHNLKKLKHYTDPVPLFTRFQIESQIESAFAHTVSLPSGGSIVIDHTEALVSIDINSARATKGGDIEATALNTNLEAADEIARQLRIRDLGGLIVIDFIDMGPAKHQRDVENRLREAVRKDRARVQIGKISRFGLLEMSRQRLRPSIGESAHMTCPRCSGFGNIRSVESLALAILRIVGEEARKERTAKVIAQLPVEVSTYLLNEKRDWVQGLEDSNDTQIVLVANHLLETPHYEVRRVRDDQAEMPENAGASYMLADSSPEPESPQAILERKNIEMPAVGTLKPNKPAPKRAPEPEPEAKPEKKRSLFDRIAAFFSTDEDAGEEKPQRQRQGSQQKPQPRAKQSQRHGDDKRPPQQRKKKQTRKKAKKSGKPAPAEKAEARSGDEKQSEQKRPTRNRRSRGGRRRRRSADQQDKATGGQKQAARPKQDKPADSQKQTARPKQDPPADSQKQATEPKLDKPADSQKQTARPKQDQPADSQKQATEPKQDRKDAPDKAASPSAKKPDQPAASGKSAGERPAEGKSGENKPSQKKSAKPRDGGNGSTSDDKPKLLPWEPRALPDESQSGTQQPGEKSGSKPAEQPQDQ
ncbi:MAG: Rne/Rng family ribonuclease [Woeseiaceae bacterium]